jgi:hypothetical protein
MHEICFNIGPACLVDYDILGTPGAGHALSTICMVTREACYLKKKLKVLPSTSGSTQFFIRLLNKAYKDQLEAKKRENFTS